MSRAITVLLAEDHQVVREGLRALLSAQGDLAVVGEVSDGNAVVDAVLRFKPTVLVVDLMLPGLSGLEVTRQVAECAPATRIVVLSMHGSEGFVEEALRNGAAGYVVKDAGAAELVRAVREVAAGRRYLSPPLSQRAIDAYAERAASGGKKAPGGLTPREREVLRLSAEGLTAPEIAERLHISPRTVETHRSNLMHKLNLQNHTDLVRFALQQGLISSD